MTKEVFAPGEYISEELEARGWTHDDLARIMGRPLPATNRIITGKAPLTTEIAMDLGAAFGTSAEVWLNLEAVYRRQCKGTLNRSLRIYGKGVIKMARPSGFKPSQSAPRSGQYQQIGPRGGKGREVTAVKGETLPPTTGPGSTYTLVDPSKNKSGGK